MILRPAVILAITLFVLYAAAAWAMLRSVTHPRLAPLAWALSLASIVAHSDAIVHMMRVNGSFSIGVLEAISLLAWTLGVLACLIAIERQNRVLAALLLASAAAGAVATDAGHGPVQALVPGWELTAHILLSMGAAALLFAAAVTAMLLVFLDRRLRTRRIDQCDMARVERAHRRDERQRTRQPARRLRRFRGVSKGLHFSL